IAAYPQAYASPSSFNNFWGVPLTLCNADPRASVWVVEMGMNQAGEIARLSELTKPTVALVVNVQPVHLEKLGSLEAIRREKVSIAQGLPDNGVLVLPADVAAPEWNGKVVRFGEASEVQELKHAAEGEGRNVAALGSLKARPVASGRRIAILGDMLELGADAPAYHAKLANDLPGIDGIYCVGTLMRDLYDLVPADRALGWHEDPATLDPQEIA